jgi:predicted nucleic acid-binding protein
MRIFVDTSAWFALNARNDGHHERARRFVASLRAEPVLFLTNDYIIDETLTLLRFRVSHTQARSFLRLVERSPQISREQVTPGDLERAEEIFVKYRDTMCSFTDCVSFAFMEGRVMEDAFAFDADFSQFGIRVHPARE